MPYTTTAESCNESTALLKMEPKAHPNETLPHGWRGRSVLSGKGKRWIMGLKLDGSRARECSVFRNAVYLLPGYKPHFSNRVYFKYIHT